MNFRQKVSNVIRNVKSLGNPLKWNNTQGGTQFFTDFVGQIFGITSGFLSIEQQRSAYKNNGTFSRVINNVVDGIVSLPIRSETDKKAVLDKEFLRSAIYDFILGSGWVECTIPRVGDMFEKPTDIDLKAVRDSEMNIIFDNESEPLYYIRNTGGSTQKIEKTKNFDSSSNEVQLLHVFQSNPYVGKKESYRGVGNAASEGFLLKASQNRDEAEANFLENKGISMLLSNKSNIPVEPDIEEEINKVNKNKIGGAARFGGVNIVNGDYSAIKLSTDAQDLKLLETGTSHAQKISSIFRLDSILFGDKTKSIFNTVKAAKVGAYTDCYIPIFNEFIAPINKYLGSDYKVFVKEISILEDAKIDANNKQIEVIQRLALTEFMTMKEAKHRINKLLGNG